MKNIPNPKLLKEVRGALVSQGTSLNAVCADLSLTRQNVAKALTGEWKGPRAARVCELILARASRTE